MKAIASLGGLLLFLVALLSGGCSLYFTLMGDIIFGDPGLFLIWASGFALCAVAFLIGRRLFRYARS